ncbi:NeuD/PglB/VioB family sugar acetyltransferase [Flavobacterium yafengii]|uniref:NeuD/PglB/VioB family sugar acetyltransferase n=1 Tax=Flavobacterium yafengii TaxID=3041253 RepID=A0AAW6TRF1_9FLAO|nr:NeuD/PglB/VioB family sugar acetyltransferase [Flavobacterium yafengii]MDI5950733.1 NeuD/PglB/VioB family sugar acetyltransferase [Flavobacterium yafengii]
MEDTQFNNLEVIIIGAGGLAREIVSWHNTSKQKLNTKIIGFLDDNLNALDSYETDFRILGKVDLDLVKNSQSVIFAISNVETKKNLLEKAINSNVQISNYIHESTFIGERTSFGKGLVMLPYSILSCDSIIGDLVFINNGSQIGHDVHIGDFTSIMANVDIGGGAIIGKNVFIGSNAVILPGVKIPDNTRIGAGSVVLKSIKQEGTYFGNPAKKIF